MLLYLKWVISFHNPGISLVIDEQWASFVFNCPKIEFIKCLYNVQPIPDISRFELIVYTLAHLVHQATVQIPSSYTIRVCNKVSQSCVTVIPPLLLPHASFTRLLPFGPRRCSYEGRTASGCRPGSTRKCSGTSWPCSGASVHGWRGRTLSGWDTQPCRSR